MYYYDLTGARPNPKPQFMETSPTPEDNVNRLRGC